MIDMFDVAGKVAIVVAIVEMIVTVFLIVNTIKLTISSRKREISIMRVVGASNVTIKGPFVVEGFLIGVFGSIIPIVVVVYGYYWVYNLLGGKLLTDIIVLLAPSAIVFKISLFIVLIGAVVGMLGSASAVRKYLKV